MAQLDERSACRLTVKLLALAHEENCEAALAEEIDACLRAGKLPELDRLKVRFAPQTGAMPDIRVMRAPLAGYGELLDTAGQS